MEIKESNALVEPEKIIEPKRKKTRRVAMAVGIVALLFGGVEALIIRSYVDSSRMTSVFSDTVDSTTFLANVMREFFLYERELIGTPIEDWKSPAIGQRRAFLNRQIDLLAQTGRTEQFRENIDALRYQLSSINGLVRDPSFVSDKEADVKKELAFRLERLGLQLKRAFDAEETLLFGAMVQAVGSREQSQRFLVVLAGLVFVLAALVTGAWGRSVRSRLGNAYKALVQEMDERKVLQDKLSHQAFHDALTGLANRELFRNDLEKAFGRAERKPGSVALLYLDLDNFKAVNDTLGHEAGDELLKAVAERLRDSVRPSDTAARLGGDEFAVVIDDIASPRDVVRVAERIVEALSSIPQLDREVPVHASIGIAISDDETLTVDDLLRNADYAMYEAKLGGKNGYRIFDREMAARALDAGILEQELREGIAQEELVLHYQPIVSLADRATLGFEALVRWNHPTRGFIPPDEFIGLAEEKGLIVSLDRWVLQEACRQLAAWKERFSSWEDVHVSVNISAAHFEDAGLVADVARALVKSGLDARSLHLEVTESTLMRDKDAAAGTLRELKRLGVSISLDDFGTGYSSLSYLRTFPLDTLKVDRSFVADVAEGPEEAALAKAIVRLAHTLNLEVVAEGIEDEAQAAELVKMGCESGQGFLFARPQAPALIDSTMTLQHEHRMQTAAPVRLAIA